MTITPAPGQHIRIQGGNFWFQSHPALPGFAFALECGKGTVFRLMDAEGKSYALKAFRPGYRTLYIPTVCAYLPQLRKLPGMDLASRVVLLRDNALDAIMEYPDLEYAVLMPWINGLTAAEVFGMRRVLDARSCARLAFETAHVLSALEQLQLAHTDISSSNVILQLHSHRVVLTGLESLYASDLPKPPMTSDGTPGYCHTGITFTPNRSEYSDRFAGAILISELLAWRTPEVRYLAWGESFFSPEDLGEVSSERKSVLESSLRAMDQEAAELFEQAWYASSLQDCPSLQKWFEALLRIATIYED